MHGGSRTLGEVGDGEQVVPVAVRDQNRDAARPHLGEPQPDRRGIAARIDDDRLPRAPLGADEVAVRPDRAQHVLFDVGRHGLRV